MSPGSTPGAWSASPPKVIFCPCLMPLSTWTSRIFTSFTTFLPSHFLQRSFSLMTSPGADQTRGTNCNSGSETVAGTQKHTLTFSVAVGTHRLHLLDHAWSQLSDHDAHAPPPAGRAFLYGARLASLSESMKEETRQHLSRREQENNK